MVPSVRHFESLTLWIQLRPGLRDRAWKVTNEHSRKLTKLPMTIFSKFWLRDRYPICIHGSQPRCFTCIAEQVSSEVVDMFLGAGGPWPVISRNKRRNGQICPFSFEDIILLTVDPCALFLTIAIAAASAAVSWAVCWVDFADSTSADHFDFNRLYSTAVNKVRCLQCSQMF